MAEGVDGLLRDKTRKPGKPPLERMLVCELNARGAILQPWFSEGPFAWHDLAKRITDHRSGLHQSRVLLPGASINLVLTGRGDFKARLSWVNTRGLGLPPPRSITPSDWPPPSRMTTA